MRRWALAGALAVLALGAWFVVRPFMAELRDIPAEVPSPAALREADTVPLVRDHPVCFPYAVAETHSQQAQFKVSAPAGPAGELRLSMVATDDSGYRANAVLAPGTPDGQLVTLAVPPPAKPVPLRVCFENRGEPVALYASGDRTTSRSIAVVDGRPTRRSVWFSFHEATPHSITQRLPVILQRMTVFRPGYVGRGLLWLLFVGVLIGVPAGLVWVYVRAVGEEDAARPRRDVNKRRSTWWRRLEGLEAAEDGFEQLGRSRPRPLRRQPQSRGRPFAGIVERLLERVGQRQGIRLGERDRAAGAEGREHALARHVHDR